MVVVVALVGALAWRTCRQSTLRTEQDAVATHRSRNVAPPKTDTKRPPKPAGNLRLEGQVIDSREQPVAGATVSLRDDDRTLLDETATTAADGSFAFEHLPAMNPVYVSATNGDALASPVRDVALVANAEPVVLKLWPTTSLTVRIVDADTQERLSGATIVGRSMLGVWVSTEDESPTTRATSDHDGVAVLHHLFPGGSVIAWVRASPYETAMIRPSLAIDPSTPNEILVALDRGAPVSGFVRTTSGAPVFPASVTYESDQNNMDTVDTDATGAFHFECLSAGRHIFFTAPRVHSVVDLDGHPRNDLVLTIPDIKSENRAEIRGIVVDDHGAPVAGATVAAHAREPYESDYPTTGPDGRFTARLEIEPAQDVELDVRTDAAVTRQLTIVHPSDRASEVRLQLSAPVRTAGVVLDRNGQPVAGAYVGDVDGAPHTTTDTSGHFELPATREPELALVSERPKQIGHSKPTPVTARNGQRDVKIVIDNLATIRGRVTLDGVPVTSFTITLEPPSAEHDPRLRFDRNVRSADGTFELDDVATDTWKFWVGGPGFQPTTIASLITAGRDVDLGIIAVECGQRVHGRVIDQRGMPIANASVSVEQHLPYSFEEPYARAASGLPTTTSDASGQFTLSGIAPATSNRIVARHPVSGSSVYYLLDEHTTSIDLVITSTGSIEGDVDRHISYFVKLNRVDDPMFWMYCRINYVEHYRCDNLVPGDYVLTPEGIALAPAHVTVHANDHLHLDLTLPASEDAVDIVVDDDCRYASLETDEAAHTLLQRTTCKSRLTVVPAGRYRLCADDHCTPIVVAATPDLQHFHVP
jgi:protocatechuate 3,4-dioxygenase beta subunit